MPKAIGYSENTEDSAGSEPSKPPIQALSDRLNALRFSKLSDFQAWAAKFNTSQLCYFAAILLLLFYAIFNGFSATGLLLAGFIAFVGLFREIWLLFQRIWQHSIGKALVLVLYAGTTNFVLAFSAIRINQVTGIEPSPFVFTMGFTTFITLPFWMIISNVLFLSIWLIVANILLFASIPLKIVGITLPVHWEDKHRARTTMLLRILLIPVVIYSIFVFASPYLMEVQFGNKRLNISTNEIDDPVVSLVTIPPTSAPIKTNAIQTAADITAQLTTQIGRQIPFFDIDEYTQNNTNPEVTELSDELLPELENSLEEHHAISRMIATFIYNFESYAFSSCQKQPEQHSVIIDENMVLLITPDNEQVNGYRFEVQACVPVYKK